MHAVGLGANAAERGDLNCDGAFNGADIDHSDVDPFLSAWDSQAGDPNWNPNADLDDDGHVGQDDLGTKIIWTTSEHRSKHRGARDNS